MAKCSRLKQRSAIKFLVIWSANYMKYTEEYGIYLQKYVWIEVPVVYGDYHPKWT